MTDDSPTVGHPGPPSVITTGDDAATGPLLAAELDERFAHPGYLPWFYRRNPRGEAIEANIDDPSTHRRIGHYAVIPTAFRSPDGTGRFIFSTNVATDSTVRKGGLFRTMAASVYERARDWGAPGMVGVGNDASTVVVVDRFGWKSLGPLPVKVGIPRRSALPIESIPVTPELLASTRFAELTCALDDAPVEHWTQSWDTEFLRWRLARPDAGYVLHVAVNALAVSVRARAPLGIPAAVVLKVWSLPGVKRPVHAGHVVAAACRAHRAPFYVYAGFNAHVTVPGLQPPRRLLPSPLNLVYKELDAERAPAASFQLDTWEFLDMDAY